MKKFITSALAALTLSTTLPVVAQQHDTNTMKEHMQLVSALRSVGVRIRLNDAMLCKDNADGVYYSQFRLLVICQDNSVIPDNVTGWTDNDLDTLRHEAHHVVQDCAMGGLGDSQLALLFQKPEEYDRFINSSLTKDQIKNISRGYGGRGMNSNEVVIELEAFAAAASVSAETIANKVVEFCS